jgi:hypothetical protein
VLSGHAIFGQHKPLLRELELDHSGHLHRPVTSPREPGSGGRRHKARLTYYCLGGDIDKCSDHAARLNDLLGVIEAEGISHLLDRPTFGSVWSARRSPTLVHQRGAVPGGAPRRRGRPQTGLLRVRPGLVAQMGLSGWTTLGLMTSSASPTCSPRWRRPTCSCELAPRFSCGSGGPPAKQIIERI